MVTGYTRPWKDWQDTNQVEPISIDFAALRKYEMCGPGIRVCPLHVNRKESQATMLVYMEPGAQWPAHVHNGGEEVFVLEGDLQQQTEEGEILSTLLKEDFERALLGSRHNLQSTVNGCLLFIRCSLKDSD